MRKLISALFLKTEFSSLVRSYTNSVEQGEMSGTWYEAEE